MPGVMAAKRPKLDLLLTSEEFQAEEECDKLVVREVKDMLEVLKEASMQDLSPRCLKRLPEDT